jgi:predicted nucleic acid-binding protein
MRWVLGDGSPSDREYADKVLTAMANGPVTVPVTWGLEVANVLNRMETKGLMPRARTEAFIERLSGMDIEADGETYAYALSDTLELARRFRITAYDASYLELALRLDIPLATLDEGLRKAAKKAGVKQFT